MSTQAVTKKSGPLSALQPRQRKYLDGISKGLTKREAALAAGYAESTANSASHIETPDVKAAFQRLMRQYAPAHKIAKRITEGLDAMETKFFQKEGIVTDSRDVINWSERRQYAQLAADLGGYAASKEAGAVTGVAIQVNVEHIGSQSKVTAEAIPVVELMG